MTDKEFINGIINGDYNENDVIARCKETPNLKALYAEMIVQHSKLLDIKPPIVSFADNATLGYSNPIEYLTIEQKRQLGRIDNAMAVVEYAMEEPQLSQHTEQHKQEQPKAKRNGKSKETDFTDCILHHDTDKVMNALSELLRGKGGTEAAAIIFVLVENGIIARPTTDLLISTFEVNFDHRNNFNTPYSAFENVKNNAFTNVQKKKINKAKKQISNFLCL